MLNWTSTAKPQAKFGPPELSIQQNISEKYSSNTVFNTGFLFFFFFFGLATKFGRYTTAAFCGEFFFYPLQQKQHQQTGSPPKVSRQLSRTHLCAAQEFSAKNKTWLRHCLLIKACLCVNEIWLIMGRGMRYVMGPEILNSYMINSTDIDFQALKMRSWNGS